MGKRLLGFAGGFISLVTLYACVGDQPAATTTDGGTCAADEKACGGTCAKKTNPALGCSATECTPCAGDPTRHLEAICSSGGTCDTGTACTQGFDDCDKNAANGCETSQATDAKNCGTCGNVCGATNTSAAPTCAAGKCTFACDGSYAHCGTDDSKGCETNVSTDATNCGKCGHSCEGGACVAGRCQAVVATTSTVDLNGIAVLGTDLFATAWYAPPGFVLTVPTSAVSATATWTLPNTYGGVKGGASASPMTTNGTQLVYGIYYDDRPDKKGGVWRVDSNGANDALIAAGGPLGGACASIAPGAGLEGIAFDTNYIYWTHSRDAGSHCPGIYRADKSANVAIHLPATYFGPMVSDGSGTVYVIETSGAYPFDGVAVKALTGATIDNTPLLIAQQGKPSSVQYDSAFVYWNDSSNAHFYRVTKVNPGAPQDVTPSSGMPSLVFGSFLVDGTDLYFRGIATGGQPQSLYRMPKDGSSPPLQLFVMTSTSEAFGAITQDAKQVYWTTSYGGAGTRHLYRLAK